MISNFWHWYVALFSDTDNKVKIAAWTATIATFGFLITTVFLPTFRYLKSKFLKIKVEANISYQHIYSPLLGAISGAPLLTVTITNLTNKSIFIKKPLISTSTRVDGRVEHQIVILNESNIFPKKLEHGEVFKKEYDTSMLYPNLLSKLDPADKVGFKVHTTTGKVYSSNQFTQQHITGHMQKSDDLNRR